MDESNLLYKLRRKWWPLWSPQLNMFNLMSNCCRWASKIHEPVRKVTVLVVGLDKAGKSSSVRVMLRVPPGDIGPTLGCVRAELRVENFLVTLLDVGGCAEARGTWRDHYGAAHGVVFVVDSSDRQRIKEVKELLADLLSHPRVAGKPLLVLANKQDKMHAFLGSELIEMLSLERLVNQSRSLCHIEPCSALMDLRRWSDRKTLRGLRWLLRAVYLDYVDLCSRVVRDSVTPLSPEDRDRDRERRGKTDKGQRGKTKDERMRSSKSELPQDKEKRPKTVGSLRSLQNVLEKESTLKKKLTKKKKKKVKIKDKGKGRRREDGEEEEEEHDGTEGDQDNSAQKDRASSALISPRPGKLKRKPKVKEETVEVPESLDNEDKLTKGYLSVGKGEKKKTKKVVKVKKKNKINSEEVPVTRPQPVDLSTTFDLYRKAILALKERQEQGH